MTCNHCTQDWKCNQGRCEVWDQCDEVPPYLYAEDARQWAWIGEAIGALILLGAIGYAIGASAGFW